jgi:hypothetical protein
VRAGFGSGSSGTELRRGFSALPEGVGTTAGSFGGLIVDGGSPSVEVPLLPFGVVVVGGAVPVGVLSVEGGVVVAVGGTCAINTCGGGFVGV